LYTFRPPLLVDYRPTFMKFLNTTQSSRFFPPWSSVCLRSWPVSPISFRMIQKTSTARSSAIFASAFSLHNWQKTSVLPIKPRQTNFKKVCRPSSNKKTRRLRRGCKPFRTLRRTTKP
jgi:hypothetical protein